MSTRVVVVGLGMIALVAGCGSSSSGGAATQPTAIAVTTSSPSQTATPSDSASTTPTAPATATVTATAPASSTHCASSSLALSLGASQGTAGTSYQAVVFTNTGSSPCTLFGYPGVSFVSSGGALIGKPASQDPGKKVTVTLAPGAQAHALLRQPDAGNFPSGACHKTTADRLRVYPPGQTVPLFAHDAAQVCSTAAGRTGIAPVAAGSGE